LPCLYILFSGKEAKKAKLPKALTIAFLAGVFSLLGTKTSLAQNTPPLTLDSAISIAVRNNLQLKATRLNTTKARVLQKTAFDLPKSEIMLTQDPTSGGNIDNAIGITQSFAWLGLYSNHKKLLTQQTLLAERSGSLTRNEIVRNVKTAYYSYLQGRETLHILAYQDSIYGNFIKKAEVRFKTGETSNLELINARNKFQEVQALKIAAEADLQTAGLSLQQLLNTREPIWLAESKLTAIPISASDTIAVAANPQVNYDRQQIAVADARIKVEKSKNLPDFRVGYNEQLLIGAFNPAGIDRSYFPGTRIGGIQFGVGIPLFSGSANRARVKSEQIESQIAQTNYQNTQSVIRVQYEQELAQYRKYKQVVNLLFRRRLKAGG